MPRTRTRISIGDARSLNWRTHALFAVLAMLSAGFFDFDRLGGNPGIWLLLSVVGLVVTIGVIEGLSAAFKKPQWDKPRVWLVLLILAVAGFSRGGTLFLLGGALEVVPDSDLAFRLVGGPVFVVSIYLLVDTMVSSFITHQDQADSLNARREHLQRARADFEREIARLTEAQRAQVRELVAPSVWELQKFLSAKTKNVQDAIFEIKSLNETIVRPLSRRKTSAQDGTESQLLTAELSTVARRSGWVPERVSIHQSLNLGFFGLVVLVIGFNAQAAALGPFRGLTLMAATLPVIMFAVWAFKLAT